MASQVEPTIHEEDEKGMGTIIHKMGALVVRKYPNNHVIKQGDRVAANEVAALRFAAELKLPVPTVYDSGTDLSGKENSIEMDFVEGERLDKIWKTLSDTEKLEICQDLKEIMTKMRAAPHPTQLIGSMEGGKARDLRQYFDYDGGPFSDETQFNEFYLDFAHRTPKPIYRAFHSALKDNHRIVFSHGDLSQHNIMIKDNKISGLLDWEYAGWYPEHWDYIKFFDRPASSPDWRNYADIIFPQSYDEELLLHQAIIRWQSP